MWKSWEGVAKYQSALLLPGYKALWTVSEQTAKTGPAMSCPPVWCWYAYSFQCRGKNLGAVPAAAKLNACCSPPWHLPGVVKDTCWQNTKWLPSQGLIFNWKNLWLWPTKASTKKEWNTLGREAGVLIGSGVKEHKFFPIPFSTGWGLAQGMWDTKGGCLWRLGYLVWCSFSNCWSFPSKVPLGTLVCDMLLRPFLIVWNLILFFWWSQELGFFCLYFIYCPVLSPLWHLGQGIFQFFAFHHSVNTQP